MADSSVILVSGANTGLGLEIIKSLCRSSKQYQIFLGARTFSNGEAAAEAVRNEYPESSSTITVVGLDLASDTSLEEAVEKISSTCGRLDILVNNGGASFDSNIVSGKMSIREVWNKSWDTNVAGTQVLTTLAMPLLLKSSDPRLIFMTSGTSSLIETEKVDNPMLQRLNTSPPQGWPKDMSRDVTSYRSTKTGLNMMMREWARLLKNDGVKIWNVSPGFLATGLGGVALADMKKMGAIDPSIGANFTVDVIEGRRDGDVGKVIRKDAVQPW